MNYKFITGEVLEIDKSSGWTDGMLLEEIYPESSFVSGNNPESMMMKPFIKDRTNICLKIKLIFRIVQSSIAKSITHFGLNHMFTCKSHPKEELVPFSFCVCDQKRVC